MNRYLLFSGPSYYANGGWRDFVGDYASADDAVAAGRAGCVPDGHGDCSKPDWWHVVDGESGRVIACEENLNPEEIVDGRFSC